MLKRKRVRTLMGPHPFLSATPCSGRRRKLLQKPLIDRRRGGRHRAVGEAEGALPPPPVQNIPALDGGPPVGDVPAPGQVGGYSDPRREQGDGVADIVPPVHRDGVQRRLDVPPELPPPGQAGEQPPRRGSSPPPPSPTEWPSWSWPPPRGCLWRRAAAPARAAPGDGGVPLPVWLQTALAKLDKMTGICSVKLPGNALAFSRQSLYHGNTARTIEHRGAESHFRL